MLDKYDSHTKISFDDDKYLPIDVKIINNKFCIVYSSSKYSDYRGKVIEYINDIPISTIYNEIRNLCCYSTTEYLNSYVEAFITSYDRLRSLPSIDNDSNIYSFKFNDGSIIKFKYGEYQDILYNIYNDNYSYKVINDNIIYIVYNSCRDKDKMIELINNISNISRNKNINNYIVDIRNNRGGDSSITKYLIEFLKDKNIVCLTNEKVFSSGRMALINLINIGSFVIGTDISTSLNSFGNNPGKYLLPDYNMSLSRSSTYWFYDSNYNLTMYDKSNFNEYFNTRRELLEPNIIHPDLYCYLDINDYINNKDSQLEEAIKYFYK